MVHALLQAGMRAPSADNRHTLRFAWRGDTQLVLSTHAPSWAELPHRRLLAPMGYDAVLENLRLRSLEFGLALHEQLFPDPAEPHRIAELQWTATSQSADPLSAHIEARHTNRRFYQRRRLTLATLEHLNAAALRVPGTQLRWLDAPAERRAVLRAIRLAETERFKQPELHRELFSAVRFDVGWKDSADVGLPPAALEVEAPMRAPFAALRYWPVMRGMSWLGAQAQGLALQPMAAATVLSVQQAVGGWVRPAVQARIRAALAVSDTYSYIPCRLFRLGRSSAPAVTARRNSPHLDAS